MNKSDLALEWEDAVRWVLSTPQGRRFVSDLIESAGKLRMKSFTGEASSTFFNEGQRSVAIWLAHEVERTDEALFDKMVAEAAVVRRLRRAAVAKEHSTNSDSVHDNRDYSHQ